MTICKIASRKTTIRTMAIRATMLLSSLILLGPTLFKADAADFTSSRNEDELQQVASPVTRIFVPHLFDNQDNAQVILHGYFANSCLQPLAAGYTLDESQKHITLWAESGVDPRHHASPDETGHCLRGRFSFLQVVDLCALPAGMYQVSYSDKSLAAVSLPIAYRSAEESENEVLFAPVDAVVIQSAKGLAKTVSPSTPSALRAPFRTLLDLGSKADKGSKKSNSANQSGPRLTLQGTFPHFYQGCMELTEIRTELSPTGVVVVEPLARMIDESDDESAKICNDSREHSLYSFSASRVLPAEASKTAPLLIYVRLPEGGSISQLLPAV